MEVWADVSASRRSGEVIEAGFRAKNELTPLRATPTRLSLYGSCLSCLSCHDEITRLGSLRAPRRSLVSGLCVRG